MFFKKKIALLLSFCFLFSLSIYSQTGNSDSSSIKKMNNLLLDIEKKEIRINCSLAIESGILEFFLVDTAGRTYESVFKINDNKPSELHFMLLLLGYEPIPYNEYYKILKSENALEQLKQKKCLLRIEISHNGKTIPLSSLLKNRETKESKEAFWVFTGASFNQKNQYTADYSDVYISIWPENAAVINLLADTGNPYRGELGFEINENHGFPKDEAFTLILREVN
jgi:hypothetical protein